MAYLLILCHMGFNLFIYKLCRDYVTDLQ